MTGPPFRYGFFFASRFDRGMGDCDAREDSVFAPGLDGVPRALPLRVWIACSAMAGEEWGGIDVIRVYHGQHTV